MFIKSKFGISTSILVCSLAAFAQDQPIVIKAGTVLDGKGGIQRNASIVVVGSKIEKVGASAKGAIYDLHNLTVLPGMIDTHVHIGWHFGPDGRYQPRDESQIAACCRGRAC
jgi:imidazolonepropionase-like amidohydrolase